MRDDDDAFRAGRLIQYGLQARQRPAQEPAYRELVDRYLDRMEFRELVRQFADGLGLSVLDAGDHGIVLGPMANSAFALRASEFRPGNTSTEDRLLDGLVQLAIAATIFPTSRELEEHATIARPPVTVDEIEDNLRRLCKRIEEERQHAPDPESGEEESGLYEAWRVYQSRLAVHETADKRQSRRATRRIIEYALEHLSEFGCFVRESKGSHAFFQPTWRYQVLVRELAALRMFERLRASLERATTEGR